ncbi:MAG TPA: tetratricopeptide repeat protein [Aeromicrobium sp.]|nr:tetratricopeptide repeat protein [Aeromicrobium sp.]HKY59353.1 tetratricopeptide repeat protein [Aeromicrobium sp.]
MSFSRPGAVDLSGLAGSAADGAPAGSPGGGNARWAFDVTDQNFQTDVLQASMRYIVVLHLWSPRSPQSQAFNDVLARVVDGYDGRLVLARVDVDANPAIAQALGAQAVPLAVAILSGQPVPLFQGTLGDDEVRQYFDQLVTAAVQNGVTGRAEPTGDAGAAPIDEESGDAPDPRFAAADEALGNGDVDAAIAEYERLQSQHPGDQEVAERLAGVRLIARTRGAELNEARAKAAEFPDDVEAQFLVADLDISGGHVDDAFGRLIDLVGRLAGDDRERVRARLVELFTVVGTADPRVAQARRALASRLF